jgi:hypothetical protein
VRWHRMGFAAFWRWKSRSPGGRPRIAKELRDLIRRMSLENPFWGAPKIPGELLKLGIDVAPLSHTGLRLPFALPAAKAGHIGHPNCLCCGERSGRRRPGCEFGAAGRQRDRSFGPVMASMMASAECAMNRQTMGWCAHNELTFDGGEDTLHSTTPADW